jgi:hypothetical protein
MPAARFLRVAPFSVVLAWRANTLARMSSSAEDELEEREEVR